MKGGNTQKMASTLITEHVSAVLAHFVTVMSGQHIMFNDYNPTDFAAVVVVSDLLGPDGSPRNAGNGEEGNVWAGGYGATAAGNAALLKDSFAAASAVLDGAKAPAAKRPALLYAETQLTAGGGSGVNAKAGKLLKLLQTAKQNGAAIDGVLLKLRCARVATAVSPPPLRRSLVSATAAAEAGAASRDGHLSSSTDECSNADVLVATISAFGSAGFSVWISIDFGTTGVETVARACAGSKDCKALHFGEGFTDGFCAAGGECLLTKDYKAKPAFVSLQMALDPLPPPGR